MVLALRQLPADQQLQPLPRGQWWCRECFKRYYAEGRAHHRQRTNALKRQRVAEAQQLVLEYLGTRPCADCGERDPVVLEFDHVGAKRAEVSMLVRRGVLPAVPMQEIARCEVVCANCHRRRTAGREGCAGSLRDLAAGRWRRVRHERNVRFVVAALIASGCVDCGERDACVLEFDHLGEKTGQADGGWRATRSADAPPGRDRTGERVASTATGAARRQQAGISGRGARYPQRESNSRYEIVKSRALTVTPWGRRPTV